MIDAAEYWPTCNERQNQLHQYYSEMILIIYIYIFLIRMILIKLKEGSPCDMNAEVFFPISCQVSSSVTRWNNEAQNVNGKFQVNIHAL